MPKEFRQIAFEFIVDEPEQPPEVSLPAEETPAPQEPAKRGRGRLSLKMTTTDHQQPEIPADDILFQKQYYTIGEVAAMFKVNNSLLRYWEKEFDIFQLRKNRKGDRYFRPADVKNVELVYDLLRRRKFTIEGAKTFIKKAKQLKEKHDLIQSLQKLKSFLLELKANL